jgi:hypothetical protein
MVWWVGDAVGARSSGLIGGGQTDVSLSDGDWRWWFGHLDRRPAAFIKRNLSWGQRLMWIERDAGIVWSPAGQKSVVMTVQRADNLELAGDFFLHVRYCA